MFIENIINFTDHHLSLKTATASDLTLLRQLYSQSREDELNASSFSPGEIRSFIASQFKARESHYAMRFPRAESCIIKRKKQPIGRLLVEINHTFHIIDLAIAKKHRNRGYATDVIKALCQHAADKHLPVTLQVHTFNTRAIRLYERLGFITLGLEGDRFRMQHPCASAISRPIDGQRLF